jgi:ATP-binding cassette subfamily B protein
MALFIFIFGLLFEVGYQYASALSFKFLIDDALIPQNPKALIIIFTLLIIGGAVTLIAGIISDYAMSILRSN